MMTWFRERVTLEMLAEVNDYIIGRKKKDEKEVSPSVGGTTDNGEKQHDGTLILDATCCPQNIRFPTDASLLNEGREQLEGMVDSAHQAGATEETSRGPTGTLRGGTGCGSRGTGNRPIRRSARRYANSWATSGGIRAPGRYPGHATDVLTAKQLEQLAVIRAMYEQEEMFDKGTRRVEIGS